MTSARSDSIATHRHVIEWCCRRGMPALLLTLGIGCTDEGKPTPHITAPDLPIPLDTTRNVRLQRVDLTTVTTGVRLDPDGYAVVNDAWGYDVGDGATVLVPTNGTVTLRLTPRGHILGIVGVAENCTGEELDNRPIDVPPDDEVVTRVVFHLTCGP